MASIKIDTQSLKEKIENLKNEKIKIDAALENFESESSKIDQFWSGDSGEYVIEQTKEYTDEFEYISNKLQKYIKFLEKVAKSYEDQDNFILNKIEMNGNISII